MNRLTEIIDGIVVSKERYTKHSPCHSCQWQSTDKCKQDNCTYGSALDKLAAYEDTGLEPEEMKKGYEAMKNAYDVCIEREELHAEIQEQIREYRKLEEQGLLIKLPCKVGDTVYVNKNCLSDWYCFLESKRYTRCEVIGVKKTKKQTLLNLKPLTERTANTRYHVFFPFSTIGKTVFLTREEAEKALSEVKQ